MKESEVYQVGFDAMELFTYSDSSTDLFPSVKKMQRDIVAFSSHIMHGDTEVCGHVTTGGSDSIANSVLAHKYWGKSVKGITKPNLIISHTTHLAFNRACTYYGIECRIVYLKDWKVDLEGIENAIDENTIMIGASATEYSYGGIDPIEDIAKIALKHNVGFHVDGCLGGFCIPFQAEVDPTMPLFDFRVQGVTAISLDTHKYGCGPKGLSVILFRTKELQAHLNFHAQWEGGFYHSNSVSEQKSGAIIAGSWAIIQHLGKEGYIERAVKIREAVRKVKKAIQSELPQLRLLGPNDYHTVSFQCKDYSTYAIGERIKEKSGWYYGQIQMPHAMHMNVNEASADQMDRFISDIKEAIEDIKKDPSLTTTKVGSLYGATTRITDKKLLAKIYMEFLDCSLSIDEEHANYGLD